MLPGAREFVVYPPGAGVSRGPGRYITYHPPVTSMHLVFSLLGFSQLKFLCNCVSSSLNVCQCLWDPMCFFELPRSSDTDKEQSIGLFSSSLFQLTYIFMDTIFRAFHFRVFTCCCLFQIFYREDKFLPPGRFTEMFNMFKMI